MITLLRIDGRDMVFSVDGAGVRGEYRVPVADRFYLDGKDGAELDEHIKAADAGLVYELIHPKGRVEGRFAAIPKVRDERSLSTHAAEYIARVETKRVEDPKARALLQAARVAELTAEKK